MKPLSLVIFVSCASFTALLCAPAALCKAPVQHVFKPRMILHHLHTISGRSKTNVALNKWHHLLFFPQVLARGHPLNITINGVLEQDGTNDLALFVLRIRHDFGTPM